MASVTLAGGSSCDQPFRHTRIDILAKSLPLTRWLSRSCTTIRLNAAASCRFRRPSSHRWIDRAGPPRPLACPPAAAGQSETPKPIINASRVRVAPTRMPRSSCCSSSALGLRLCSHEPTSEASHSPHENSHEYQYRVPRLHSLCRRRLFGCPFNVAARAELGPRLNCSY
jgi:hypothetical protein